MLGLNVKWSKLGQGLNAALRQRDEAARSDATAAAAAAVQYSGTYVAVGEGLSESVPPQVPPQVPPHVPPSTAPPLLLHNTYTSLQGCEWLAILSSRLC